MGLVQMCLVFTMIEMYKTESGAQLYKSECYVSVPCCFCLPAVSVDQQFPVLQYWDWAGCVCLHQNNTDSLEGTNVN